MTCSSVLREKDTRLDGVEFEPGQVLDAQRDADGDDRHVDSDEERDEPDHQRHTQRRLSYTHAQNVNDGSHRDWRHGTLICY